MPMLFNPFSSLRTWAGYAGLFFHESDTHRELPRRGKSVESVILQA